MTSSNQKLTKAAQQNAVKASSVLLELDKLAVEREKFENTDLARTNAKLYQLLANVLAQFEAASAKDEVLKDTLNGLRKKLEDRGSRVQVNSPALGVFVRYVFNSDRQRVHNYTRALQAAVSNDIKSSSLVEYITNAGGVEECKRKVVVSEATAAAQLKVAEALPLVDERLADEQAKPLATFKVPAKHVQDTHDKEFTFLIGKADSEGQVKVLGVIPAYSKGVENWARTALAKFLSDEYEHSEKKAKEARAEKSVEAAVASVKRKNSKATATVGEVLEA